MCLFTGHPRRTRRPERRELESEEPGILVPGAEGTGRHSHRGRRMPSPALCPGLRAPHPPRLCLGSPHAGSQPACPCTQWVLGARLLTKESKLEANELKVGLTLHSYLTTIRHLVVGEGKCGVGSLWKRSRDKGPAQGAPGKAGSSPLQGRQLPA